MSILTLIVACYGAMFVLVGYAELTQSRRRGLPAIFTALFLSVFAGVSACLIAAKTPGSFGWFEAASDGQAARRKSYTSGLAQGGSQPPPSLSGRPRKGTAAPGAMAGDAASDAETEFSDAGPASGLSNAWNRLFQNAPPETLTTGNILKDCDDCPEMIVVGPGSTTIGAPDSDPLADASEKPQRAVRFWPGFAISKDPITAASVAQFRLDTRRAAGVCEPATPTPPTGDAACISPRDADAYAVWLSARAGGLRYRLVSAAQWEYAARTMGAVQVASTGNLELLASPLAGMGTVLPEIVADCWSNYIPPMGREHLAHLTAVTDCSQRMTKGAHASEDRKYARPSSRRSIAAGLGSPVTGFRVVRELR
jgi:formylglycine-generating enzyme required for sulfatase activity